MIGDYAIYYIPEMNETLMLYYGTGDNLFDEDYEAGYNDYMNTYWYKGKVTESDFLDKDDEFGDGCYDARMFLFNNETLRKENIVIEVLKDWYGTDVKAEYIGCAMD